MAENQNKELLGELGSIGKFEASKEDSTDKTGNPLKGAKFEGSGSLNGKDEDVNLNKKYSQREKEVSISNSQEGNLQAGKFEGPKFESAKFEGNKKQEPKSILDNSKFSGDTEAKD